MLKSIVAGAFISLAAMTAPAVAASLDGAGGTAIYPVLSKWADDYNKQAQGKEWFDSAAYPAATFVSSAIAPAGGNQYKITGKLTIKGKSQTVVVPVTIASQGATQTFDGTLPIKRSQFDVGTGEWKDTSVVADEVVIKFHLVASKK